MAEPGFDTSWAPAEHFRCFSEIILPFFLHWREKPWDRYPRITGIPPAAGIQPIPVLSGPCGRGAGWPCPAPPESLSAPEGKKLLHKVVSEVQKLFNERNLKQLKFSTQKIPWVQQRLPLLSRQRGLFKWVLIISFYRKLVQWPGLVTWGKFRGHLPALPQGTSAPGGVCWGHTEVSQTPGDAATNNCRIKIFLRLPGGGFSWHGYFFHASVFSMSQDPRAGLSDPWESLPTQNIMWIAKIIWIIWSAALERESECECNWE